MNQKQRLRWIRLYEKLGNAGTVCLKCGISRPTLRKWLGRYEREGIDGLRDESRCPRSSPALKTTPRLEALILGIRRQRKSGVKMIRNELLRLHSVSLSLATIHKVLKRNKVEPLPKYRRRHRKTKRYNRPVPGDRVQMDVCKIAPGVYQYTCLFRRFRQSVPIEGGRSFRSIPPARSEPRRQSERSDAGPRTMYSPG